MPYVRNNNDFICYLRSKFTKWMIDWNWITKPLKGQDGGQGGADACQAGAF